MAKSESARDANSRVRSDRPGRSSRPSLRETQKEMTRQRLIDAAVEVFDEKGYPATTVEDITDAANVSRTTFYLHFNSKRDVAVANGDQLVTRIRTVFLTLAEHDHIDEKVARTFLGRYVDMLHTEAHHVIVALEANVSDADLTAQGWADFQSIGAEVLDAFVERGWTTRCADAALHLAILIPTVHYAVWGQGVFDLKAPHSNFNGALAQLVQSSVLRAVTPPAKS